MNTNTLGKRNWTVLLLFGLVGQLAWSVENMYFNLFVFETISPDLNTVTLMVQLSGVVATLTTLIAGTLSDKLGNRRALISYGYLIWGVTVALFGFLSVDVVSKITGSHKESLQTFFRTGNHCSIVTEQQTSDNGNKDYRKQIALASFISICSH